MADGFRENLDMRGNLFRLIGLLAALLMVSGAQGALVSVLGGQAVYDTDLNISWIGNANLAASNTFGLPANTLLGTYPGDTSGVDGLINANLTMNSSFNGTMNWPGAMFWIDAMNAANYLGVNDWRLPTTTQPDPTCSIQTSDVPPQGFGFGCTGSELGHLINVDGISDSSPGPFTNVQPSAWWSGTEFAPNPAAAWRAGVGNGHQGAVGKVNLSFAWAVHPGNIGAVPIPAAVWLFGSGLIGLVGLVRHKR